LRWSSDAGGSTPLLALVLSLILLVGSATASPTIALLRQLRELDARLERALTVVQAVGRLAAMRYGELEASSELVMPGNAAVRVRLSRKSDKQITASLSFLRGGGAPLILHLARGEE